MDSLWSKYFILASLLSYEEKDYDSLYDAWMLCYVMLCLRSDFLSCVNLKVQVMTVRFNFRVSKIQESIFDIDLSSL